MSEYDNRVADQTAYVTNGKWNASMYLSFNPSDGLHPFYVYDEDTSGIFVGLSMTGGKMVRARLTLPQFQLLYDGVSEGAKAATNEAMDWETGRYDRLYMWDLKRIMGTKTNFRLHSNPDKDGRCTTTEFDIFRNRVRQDGSAQINQNPWCIEIKAGTAMRERTKTGGWQAKYGTKVQTGYCRAYLNDEQMMELVYPTAKALDNLFASAQPMTLQGYKNIKRQRMN